MNKEWKEKWIEALRSGEFKQGRRQLKSDEGDYCCLGVLATIAGYDPTSEETRHNWEAYLNEDIQDQMDLSYEIQTKLAEMNDGKLFRNIPQHSFLEIADWIEANL